MVFLMVLRSTFSPRISNFSEALFASGMTHHNMAYTTNNDPPNDPNKKEENLSSSNQKEWRKIPEKIPLIKGIANTNLGIQMAISK